MKKSESYRRRRRRKGRGKGKARRRTRRCLASIFSTQVPDQSVKERRTDWLHVQCRRSFPYCCWRLHGTAVLNLNRTCVGLAANVNCVILASCARIFRLQSGVWRFEHMTAVLVCAAWLHAHRRHHNPYKFTPAIRHSWPTYCATYKDSF